MDPRNQKVPKQETVLQRIMIGGSVSGASPEVNYPPYRAHSAPSASECARRPAIHFPVRMQTGHCLRCGLGFGLV